MLSPRIVLFRSQPLNALQRHNPRVLHLVTSKSPHLSPPSFTGRTYSFGPEYLPKVHDARLTEVQCREQRLWMAELIAKAKARDVLETLTEMSDSELRRMVEDHAEKLEGNNKMKTPDHKKLRSEIGSAITVWAKYFPDLEKYRIGKEFDAEMAGANEDYEEDAELGYH